MNERTISAVVFDMDGVLLDTERLSARCWSEIADELGIPDIDRVYKRCIGRTTPDTMEILREEYGDSLDLDDLYERSRQRIFKYIREDGIPVKPQAGEVLRGLSNRGVPLALASSTRYDTVCAQLKMAGLYEYFNVIIGGDNIANGKPAPDIYLAACESLGVRPENAAAVEDSFNGIRSAHSAGLYTIMIPDMLEPDEELLKLIDLKAKDLKEAFDILDITI